MKAALALWLALTGAAEAETCALDSRSAPDVPILLPGLVRGPATQQEVVAGTEIAVARTHAPESPGYLDLPRVVAYFSYGGARHVTIAAVTDGVLPQPGESVTLVSRHRDPALPCAFIPWTITKSAPDKPTS